MAVEDGTIIATLLGLRQQSTQGSDITLAQTLKLYEELQKTRTTTLHLGSISNQYVYHIDDGDEQEERDRIFNAAEWKEKPEGESEPFIWIDVRYQKAILGRDAIGEASKAWRKAIGKN